MTLAICIALVALAAALTGLCIATGKWLHDSNNENRHLRDRLEESDAREDQYRGERDVEVAAHAVTKDELAETRNRLSVAEAQRNQAYRAVRDRVVQLIRESNVQGGSALVADLLRTDFRTGVLAPVPKADDPAADGDSLIDPFVQPP